MTSSHPTFAAFLGTWLNERGMLAPRLAEALGCDSSLVYHWSKGARTPSKEILPALCRALDLPVDAAREAYTLCGVDLSPVLGENAGSAA